MTTTDDSSQDHKSNIEASIRIALIAIMAWVGEQPAAASDHTQEDPDNT